MSTLRQIAQTAGLPRYFTGKPCPKGHVSERHTSSRACVACVRQGTAAWIELNGDRLQNNKRAWREANKDRVDECRTAWRRANVDRVKQHKSASYARHSDSIRRKNDEWAAANPDRVAAIRKGWELVNPEKVKANAHRMRAQRKAIEGSFTADELAGVFVAQRGRCNGCYADMTRGHHVDHIMPLKRGGTNYIDNIQLLCGPCNLSKGAKHPAVWRAELMDRLMGEAA